MKNRVFKWGALVGGLVCLMMSALFCPDGAQALGATGGEGDDRTLSPFFFVNSDDPETDRLPLKSTTAKVKIAGVTADVTITQVYKNEGKNTLEAVYIFPGSTRSAVYAMKMTVGERIIEAEIMERQKARETYEQAKAEGKTASLLEQQRPNVFQMNVANILPNDEIEVELKYTELIEPENQVYRFVYPAVVGPRYSNTPAAGASDTQGWVENPYLRQGEKPPYEYGLSVDLETGIPLADLSSPSHGVNIEYTGKSLAHVTLKNDPKAGTRDFVLDYRLAGGRIETGLLLYPGDDENFFLMLMEPPARVSTDDVLPREYIFIVDVSGSMNGFPLTDVAKPLMREIIDGLRPNDLMNVLLFAGSSAVLSERGSLPASESNKQKAKAWIDSRQAGGGTEILPALKRALALPRTENVSRIVVVVTDGFVSVEPEVFELIRGNLGQANLFAFGIGSSVNRYLIEGMARAGLGEPFVIMNPADGRKQAARFRQYIENPVLTDIKVRFEGFEAREVEPAAVPDLFAQRPIVVFGKYLGKPGGRITVTGQTVNGGFEKVVDLVSGASSDKNSALRLLWARHRIMRLSDLNRLAPNDRRIKEVTALGLKYSLMTQYTSFVAVDKVKRADGKLVTVKQPLPLPEGVTDAAVGGRSRLMKAAPAPTGGFGRRMLSAESAPMSMDGSMAAAEPQPVVNTPPDLKPPEIKQEEKQASGFALTVEEIRDGLDKTGVEKALRVVNIRGRLAACLHSRPAASGEIVFRLVIDIKGSVNSVRVVNRPDSIYEREREVHPE